jgi:hypothetical protein
MSVAVSQVGEVSGFFFLLGLVVLGGFLELECSALMMASGNLIVLPSL